MPWKEATEYKVLSFQLTRDFVAVFAEEAPDGLVDLEAQSIDAVGVARVTRRMFLVDESGAEVIGHEREPDVITDVVGLWLADGYFQIVNESSNFAGLARVGDDISQATGCLEGSLLRRLRGRGS
jgi:hypothetical protein